ncbi:asparagine synthetase B family protein [[Mycobacterium] wendilense]|uniref:asparagine synthase (glutamine-hydrolyzing) n=1 Tax=[Mycobacterium] wendilense TaxID=3064284 RepID=A0ABN9P8F3_9MYCO|nr:asparagine synthase-related protein [Mycolicibacterium sp. MU0050]CAJ1586994.1 asparagine synthase-related protein [Mycolicibacterium sp. MU0050]
MARWCAFLTRAEPAAQLRSVGAASVAVTDGYGLGLLDGPGTATGPHRVGHWTAVGEVTLFNGARLRALLGAGAPAADCPDAELLLHCYVTLGTAGIAAADGMFALVVTDGRDLVLIRDHVGARTLFVARSGPTWAATTSLPALRRWPGLRTGLNLPAVRSFLTFAYLPDRETLLRDVHEVLPGRCVRLRPDGSRSEEIFWEPAEVDIPATAAEHALRLRELLEEATARRLPAGPTGVLLSGGIDSSLVTALAAKLHDQPVHTYSIAFDGTTVNELAYSGLVAAHCHTTHRVLTVSSDAVAARLAQTVALLDCPVGDPLTVPNLMLAQAAADDGLDTILNGEGGDPVFGGPKNLPMLIFELFRDDPDPRARARAYLDSYRKCLEDLPVLLSPAALADLDHAPALTEPLLPYLRPGRMNSLLNQLLHTNLRTKGAHHILPKVERLTAAAGVQGRSPLFDATMIDYAFAVPPRLKLAGTEEKWILKEAVRDLLPSTIVDRPKSGMRVPVQQWLTGPLRELSHDLLLGPSARTRDIFRADTLRNWLRGDGTLLPRQGGKVWMVLTLEMWLRAYDLRP